MTEVRVPDPPRLFAHRAARLAALAEAHPAGPFLALLARVARGQEVAVREIRIPPGVRAREDGPPLDHRRLLPDGSWRAMLAEVLAAARDPSLPAAARDAIARLGRAPPVELDALAAAVLAGTCADLAAAPFVGAALQAWFGRLAAGLDPAALSGEGPDCPACGFPPIGSVVGGDDRVRRVACGLCGASWPVPRTQCALCRDAERVGYLEVEGGPPGIAAEACEGCQAYLLIADALRAPGAEATADDAAALVLHLLAGEQGWRRAGRSLLAPAGEPA